MNPMRHGGANITDKSPIHNGFTGIGGSLRTTRAPVPMPVFQSPVNPRLPSQIERLKALNVRKAGIFRKVDGTGL